MPTNVLESGSTEFLARTREIIHHAQSQGFLLATTTSDPVTLQNLPDLVRRKAAIEMVGEGGELVAISMPDGERPDTKRLREGLPAFSQTSSDGKRINFWLLPEGQWRSEKADYRPHALRLDMHILSAQCDPFDRLMRLQGNRVCRIFRSLEVETF